MLVSMPTSGTPSPDRRLADVATVCACLNTRRAARAVTQQYDELLRPAGIRATQFSLLAPAAVLGPVNLTALADAVGMDRTTLTRNLSLLEREGLVRVEAGSDLRTREVSVTPKGRKTLDRAIPLWERAQSRMAEALGPARLNRLMADLDAAVTATKR